MLTGVFAPFGVGVLGIVALAATMGAGAGILSGGFFGALSFQMGSKETVETSTRDLQPEVESGLIQESSKILSQLASDSSKCTEHCTRDAIPKLIEKAMLF